MGYFSIPTWTKYQSYQDNDPEWIKLRPSIMTSTDWYSWDTEARLMAMCLMMIASENFGIVDANPAYISARTHSDRVDLTPLLESGFILYHAESFAKEKLWCQKNGETYARIYHEEYEIEASDEWVPGNVKFGGTEKRREEESIDYSDSFVY